MALKRALDSPPSRPLVGAIATAAPDTEDFGFMRRAITLARGAIGIVGASPIGCVIVRHGEIVGEGHNEVGLRRDPTAHAEIVAMRRAGQAMDAADLSGATLYSTLQPCGMCTMAAIWGGIDRIVYGAGREDVHTMYFEDRHLDVFDFIGDAFRNDLCVVGGVLGEECATIYYRPGDEPPLVVQGNI